MFGGETTNNYKHNPRNARVDNVPTAAVTLIQSGILPNSFSDICDHGLLKKFPAFLVFIQLAALRDSGGSSSSLKTTLNVVNRENRTSRINNERRTKGQFICWAQIPGNFHQAAIGVVKETGHSANRKRGNESLARQSRVRSGCSPKGVNNFQKSGLDSFFSQTWLAFG